MMDGKRHNWLWMLLTLAVLAGAAWYWWGDSISPANQTQAMLRLQSLKQIPDSKTIGLLRTLNPRVKDIEGELVWVNSKQEGSLYIRHLPKPDTNSFYQLWVYDSHGEGKPITLGQLLAANWQTENYIPLKASTLVQEPYKFVLTLEQSDDPIPEQILLMAQP
ncbi:MAG: anti-sigma factor [Thiofilum sp.]|uniref:anti-sigma factor n=1 Tax=Thiofilum sp. TaxID=2212733 RepID=UPI0025CCD3C1|nr:anti-sigma factor [Thiofilum sp.]MBK8452309.1 anti-sigma factor [Thiofilum sp.]